MTNFGANGAGGYNGGGAGGKGSSQYPDRTNYAWGAAGGGGATHIATVTGILSSLSSNKAAVLIVAGGGGGACQNYDMINANIKSGGDGGGTTGEDGKPQRNDNSFSAKGASQSSGYSFGQGKNGTSKEYWASCGAEGNGGGGGGYYGGYSCQKSGENSNYGGGGGSGYIGGVTNGSTTAGVQSGNGKALVTWHPNI